MKNIIALTALITLVGCQTRITAEKNAEQMLPVYGSDGTNVYVVGYDHASGGWNATARSPLWATEELKGLSISVGTNGTVSLSLDAYNRDLSTNAVVVTEKLVNGAVELASKVTAAIVTAGGTAAAGSASSAISSLVAKYVASGGDADNATITCKNGSCTISDGNTTCTDGSCYDCAAK